MKTAYETISKSRIKRINDSRKSIWLLTASEGKNIVCLYFIDHEDIEKRLTFHLTFNNWKELAYYLQGYMAGLIDSEKPF